MQRTRTKRMARIGLFTALISVCAWIAIPTPTSVPMTLQSFAVLLAAGLLREWDALIAVLVYLALGIIGIPVFSGVRGGIGVLLSPTGGFLLGFLAAAAWMRWMRPLYCNRFRNKLLSMAAAQLLIYASGTLWFAVSIRTGISAALMTCVLPYLVSDAAKLLLAAWLSERLKNRI